jgi:hypothetical protein
VELSSSSLVCSGERNGKKMGALVMAVPHGGGEGRGDLVWRGTTRWKEEGAWP